MVLQSLLPWFKRSSHDGYRAVNRRRNKIFLSTKRRGWFLNTILLVSILAVIPVWIHLRYDVVELKIDNIAKLRNDNKAELKNDNMAESKREHEDVTLLDPQSGKLVSKAVKLAALRTYNLATIKNRHFAALKTNNLVEELGDIVAATNDNKNNNIMSKVNKFSKFKSANLSALKTRKLSKAKPENFPETNKELKYILQWTSNHSEPVNNLKTGQKAFIESNCPYTNCYVTNDKLYLDDDVTKFDAIIFNGQSVKTRPYSALPEARSPHQKYIFMNLESSDSQPICDPVFDGFFNWTATYKLKSDILYSFFIIKNMAGVEVGPRINMNWIEHMSDVNVTILEIVKRKTKAAAWFVSNCTTRCNREKYAESLKGELKEYNLTLDIYGKCGDLKCLSKGAQDQCQDMLRDEYFFYLAFESSCVEDYVSEKVLFALKNTLVPIVYGGSNYTRFLPPGSFIDARLYEPSALASIMAGIIASPEIYYELFKWRNHYTYESHLTDNLCRLCTALNDDTKVKTHTVYEDFRSWWNPDYEERCQEETWGT